MHFRPGFLAMIKLCVCAMVVGVATSAAAFEPVAPDEEGIQIDQAVQALKEEATLLERDANLARNAFLFPPETRLSVYLSNKVRNLLLHEVSLSIDGGAPVVHKYDEYSSRALLEKNALQRIEHTNVNNGPHRLVLTYSGETPDGEKISGRHEAAFDKTLDPSEIEIQILPGGRKALPAMGVRQWKAASQ
tara:strand:- start:17202 stop:17771 length:570 start_codon:yes stop_codon:yes gene_type:complete